MNPITVAFLAFATLVLMAAIAYADTNCTTRCETVWGQTVCKTHCD
jgi:hypothetical protein